MAIITFPSTLSVASMSWGQKRRDVNNQSLFGSQAIELSGPLWLTDISAIRGDDAYASAWKALLMKLQGKVNQLSMWDHMRPAPLGTMRGTLTLNSAASMGAVALSVTGGAGQAGTTLKQGDYLQLGSGITQQVVMVLDDATADGSGVIVVNTQPPLRNAFSGGASVVWDKASALFRAQNNDLMWDYSGTSVSGFSLSLQEDWRP